MNRYIWNVVGFSEVRYVKDRAKKKKKKLLMRGTYFTTVAGKTSMNMV